MSQKSNEIHEFMARKNAKSGTCFSSGLRNEILKRTKKGSEREFIKLIGK